MNCHHAQDRLSELLDPRHATDTTAEVSAHVAGCPACQHELASLQHTLRDLDTMPAEKPSPQLRANFYAMLADEKQTIAAAPASLTPPALQHHRSRQLWAWIVSPIAACGLLLLGFVAGQKSVPIPAPTTDSTQQQIAALQHKVDSMGQLMSYSLLKQKPAGERIQGLLATQSLKSPSDQVLTQLISALALDPSTNVRLTALETLYAHADKDVVRAGVLASLEREQNPLVQVAMIDFLVASRDNQALGTFEQLSRQTDANVTVRDAARRAIAQF